MDSLRTLAPLLHSPDAPKPLKILAHRLAARIEIEAERYARARNHLRAALRLDGYDAEIHYELGVAFENDPDGCDLRAARRFRRATQLSSQNAKYAAAFGRALVRLNRVRTGVKCLRDAARLAPVDVKVLGVVVSGLCDAGAARTAKGIVVKARFRMPQNRDVLKLWNDVRFALAQKPGRKGSMRSPSRLLPFLKVVGSTAGGSVRVDGPSRSTPHLGRLRAYRSEQG